MIRKFSVINVHENTVTNMIEFLEEPVLAKMAWYTLK